MYSSLSLISPRLRVLQSALETGDLQALAAFWQELAERGTPLIEADAENPSAFLVTFVWRATTAVQNVAVIGGVAGWNAVDSQMTHLGDTDLWFRTFRTRPDVHTIYFLSVNDPLVPLLDPNWRQVWDEIVTKSCLRHDPLNPLIYFGYASGLKLPDARPEPWIAPRTDVPAGRILTYQVPSTALRNERTIRLYLPSGAATSDGPHPWLLLFDGDSYFNLPLAPLLDNLIAAGHIPPLVVIGVDNAGPGSRLHELSCNPTFVKFLITELLPFVRERHPLTADPQHTTVGGASLGGLAAAHLALLHPEIFGNVLAQSGAFSWTQGYYRAPDLATDTQPGWLIQQFAQAPRQPLRFSLVVGILEQDFDQWGTATSTLAANQHMRDVLQARGYPVYYHEYSGGHDFIGWRSILPDALSYLTK